MPRKNIADTTHPAQDLTGKKFNRLTAVKFVRWHRFPSGTFQEVWLWECECGNQTEALKPNVTTGHTTSCKCYQEQRRIESHTKHGDAKKGNNHPLYTVWVSMNQRCYDKNSTGYQNWGGRGIRILWINYADFKRDMELGYKVGLQIERKDNDGHYCKDNCKWATPVEQSYNRRSNRIIEFEGVKMPMGKWSEKFRLKRGVISKRLDVLRWTIRRALTTPSRKRNR